MTHALPLTLFGSPTGSDGRLLAELARFAHGLRVGRQKKARSKNPFPTSQDLELTMVGPLALLGFEHHHRLRHPRTDDTFEYDFWRRQDGVAIEVMGYRADDEIYKDILKFHVHEGTRIGVVLVPRYKWVGGKKTETNYWATHKALRFADRFMNVELLVAIAYDWSEPTRGKWTMRVVE